MFSGLKPSSVAHLSNWRQCRHNWLGFFLVVPQFLGVCVRTHFERPCAVRKVSRLRKSRVQKKPDRLSRPPRAFEARTSQKASELAGGGRAGARLLSAGTRTKRLAEFRRSESDRGTRRPAPFDVASSDTVGSGGDFFASRQTRAQRKKRFGKSEEARNQWRNRQSWVRKRSA